MKWFILIAIMVARGECIATAARAPLRADLDAASSCGIPLKTYEIAYDALCIIVSARIYETVHNISIEQARAIFFTGTVTDCSQLDSSFSGKDGFYVRDQATSGAAEAFTSLLTGESDSAIPPV